VNSLRGCAVNAIDSTTTRRTIVRVVDAVQGGSGRLLASRCISILLLLVATFLYFAIAAPNFATVANVRALLAGASVTWLVAIGTTFVMILGNFDLSVGSMFTLSGVVFGMLLVSAGLPAIPAILMTLLICASIGAVLLGLPVGRFKISFLIVTLGAQLLIVGMVNVISNTKTVSITNPLVARIGFGETAGIPNLVFVMIMSLGIGHVVLNHTLFGRDVFAIGGNIAAARLSGIRVERTIVAVYAISALSAAVGGIVQASRISAASPLVGQTILFDAVAAVLLGGTSFSGGSGSVIGTAIGVLFLSTLSNGLGFMGVASYWQQVVTGVIVVLAGVAERVQRAGLPRGLRKRRAVAQ
jgi:ribose transport system permease protein